MSVIGAPVQEQERRGGATAQKKEQSYDDTHPKNRQISENSNNRASLSFRKNNAWLKFRKHVNIENLDLKYSI